MKNLGDSKSLVRLGWRRKVAAFVLGCLAVFLRLFARLKGRPAKTVLIFEPFGMGDAVSLEPLIRALKAAGYEVRLCCRSEWSALYPGIQLLPADVPWSSYSFAGKYRLNDYFSERFKKFRAALKRFAGGTIGIDPRGDIRSVLLLHLAGCRRVLTLSHYLGTDVPMLAGAAERVPHLRNEIRWKLNLSFLTKLGIDSPSPSPPQFNHLVHRDEPSVFQIALIGIAPWRGKLWQPEKWKQVIEAGSERGWKFIGLCGPKQTAEARLQLGDSIEISECSSLDDWAAAFTKCSVVVSLDTGPMHLACALGIPVVALYGQGLLPLWSPANQRSVALAHQDAPDFFQCHPIEQNTGPGQRFMSRIEAEEVIEAVARIAKAES